MNAGLTRLAAAGAAAAAAVAARRAVELGWKLTTGDEPPTARDVADDATLRDLLLWSAVVAGAVIIARKVATSATEDLLGDD
ncbi:MAG: DUF4235 domain-containing protein [Nitriliruptoraceae bacterium]|nr:DUF4235 domain-containing protein [Nitriliruptoraceae bacterium]